ncbi:PIR protein [Plasmodium vivax]|uniref:VIR protein n=1 Tax=Plasmodium vivax TaxID=5855 RepID=A0A564ZSV7_PLAVI|nr:PIR protein [Plasmodium vivax]
MPKYLGDSSLSILNTKYYYTSLNEEKDDCQNEAFYIPAKEKLKTTSWKEDASDNILKGLCYVYKRSFNDYFERNICKYLYFWLGNILLDKMRNKIVFDDIIIYLFNILKNNKTEKICELPHHYLHVNNFKNVKLFFDYSEDYNSYNQQLIGHNHSCNSEYKNYLDTYVNSYKKVRDECTKNPSHNSYCDEFHEYFKDKDVYYLSNWTCNLQEHGDEEEELVEDLAQDAQLPPGTGMGVHPTINQNEIPSVTREGEKGPDSSGYRSGERNSDLNSDSDPAGGSSTSTMKKSITSAVSAAGVLVPPFLIYNYTPAGTWISKLLGRNKGSNRNPYANQEIMENFYQPEDFYSERNRYNIMYNPE